MDRPLLVSTPANIRYLTGFAGVSETEREAFVLLSKKEHFLFTNALYLEEARKLPDVTVIEISRENPLSSNVRRVLAKLKSTKLEYEDANLTVAEYEKLKSALSGVQLTGSRDRIEQKRMIKTKKELAHIRAAAKATDQCFSYILKRIKPGITESRIAWEIEGYLRIHADGIAFDPIIAFNAHSSMPHYHARSNDPLRRGSVILLDFGAKVNGYCADMTRVVFVGTPKPEWISAYEAVLSANGKALSMLSEGETNGATIDVTAREIIAEKNLPVYPHGLGHAVGLEIHEAPRLTVKKPETLSPGMVVTVEPGTYLPGQFGIRIEDLVAITDSGIQVLSASEKRVTVLP